MDWAISPTNPSMLPVCLDCSRHFSIHRTPPKWKRISRAEQIDFSLSLPRSVLDTGPMVSVAARCIPDDIEHRQSMDDLVKKKTINRETFSASEVFRYFLIREFPFACYHRFFRRISFQPFQTPRCRPGWLRNDGDGVHRQNPRFRKAFLNNRLSNELPWKGTQQLQRELAEATRRMSNDRRSDIAERNWRIRVTHIQGVSFDTDTHWQHSLPWRKALYDVPISSFLKHQCFFPRARSDTLTPHISWIMFRHFDHLSKA